MYAVLGASLKHFLWRNDKIAQWLNSRWGIRLYPYWYWELTTVDSVLFRLTMVPFCALNMLGSFGNVKFTSYIILKKIMQFNTAVFGQFKLSHDFIFCLYSSTNLYQGLMFLLLYSTLHTGLWCYFIVVFFVGYQV